jgi:hypothetical protein
MTEAGPKPDKQRAEQALMLALMGVIGQVGCLTLLVIFVALIAGLWLDNQFHTRPLFAVGLVIASIPLTLFLMFRIVLSFAPRIQGLSAGAIETETGEEPEIGDDFADQT